jgi:hypothetical protein
MVKNRTSIILNIKNGEIFIDEKKIIKKLFGVETNKKKGRKK